VEVAALGERRRRARLQAREGPTRLLAHAGVWILLACGLERRRRALGHQPLPRRRSRLIPVADLTDGFGRVPAGVRLRLARKSPQRDIDLLGSEAPGLTERAHHRAPHPLVRVLLEPGRRRRPRGHIAGAGGGLAHQGDDLRAHVRVAGLELIHEEPRPAFGPRLVEGERLQRNVIARPEVLRRNVERLQQRTVPGLLDQALQRGLADLDVVPARIANPGVGRGKAGELRLDVVEDGIDETGGGNLLHQAPRGEEPVGHATLVEHARPRGRQFLLRHLERFLPGLGGLGCDRRPRIVEGLDQGRARRFRLLLVGAERPGRLRAHPLVRVAETLNEEGRPFRALPARE